jgi:hypothetical protein
MSLRALLSVLRPRPCGGRRRAAPIRVHVAGAANAARQCLYAFLRGAVFAVPMFRLAARHNTPLGISKISRSTGWNVETHSRR